MTHFFVVVTYIDFKDGCKDKQDLSHISSCFWIKKTTMQPLIEYFQSPFGPSKLNNILEFPQRITRKEIRA